jgi:hypothetical protein
MSPFLRSWLDWPDALQQRHKAGQPAASAWMSVYNYGDPLAFKLCKTGFTQRVRLRQLCYAGVIGTEVGHCDLALVSSNWKSQQHTGCNSFGTYGITSRPPWLYFAVQDIEILHGSLHKTAVHLLINF